MASRDGNHRNSLLETVKRRCSRAGIGIGVAEWIGWIGLSLSAGCNSPELPHAERLSPAAVELYNQGVEQQANGRPDEAMGNFRRAIASNPEFVEAHRAYQNLMVARHRRGDLLREYQALWSEATSSAPRQYLLGRLWTDRRRQLKSFERAIWSDPNLYFGNIGVGYASLDLGDPERARWAFERAIAIAPDRLEARNGMLVALPPHDYLNNERLNLARWILEKDPSNPSATGVLLRKLIERGEFTSACQAAVTFVQEYPSDSAAEVAFGILERYATAADSISARDRLAPLSLDPSFSTHAGVRLLALLEERAGNPLGALHLVKRIDPAEQRDPSIVRLRQRLLLEVGDFAGFAREVYERRFESGLELGDDGASRARFGHLRELVREGVPTTERGEDAVAILTEAGCHEAAIGLASAILDIDPMNGPVRSRRAELLRHQAFVAELREFFEREYRASDPLAFDDVIEALREISRVNLGEDVIDPVVKREFFPIGLFLDPDPREGGGLARYFDRFGAFAMVGQRLAQPAEAYVMRRIATSDPVVDGASVYRAVGEELLIRSRAEFFGAEIAGFAFQTFIALNTDGVRESARRAEQVYHQFGPDLLTDALLPVTETENATDISEPLSLAVRAQYRSYERFLAAGGSPLEYPGLLLDAVETHERAHIRDAARFLPLFSDIGDKLKLLFKHRFSVGRVEAWLEQRAQAVALADATSPMAVLASTVYFLPERDLAPPHSVGYYDLAVQIVCEVEANPQRYPAIDLKFTILPQLDRLTDDELRGLGRRLLDEFDR